jgi:hypothetical protein
MSQVQIAAERATVGITALSNRRDYRLRIGWTRVGAFLTSRLS